MEVKSFLNDLQQIVISSYTFFAVGFCWYLDLEDVQENLQFVIVSRNFPHFFGGKHFQESQLLCKLPIFLLKRKLLNNKIPQNGQFSTLLSVELFPIVLSIQVCC